MSDTVSQKTAKASVRPAPTWEGATLATVLEKHAQVRPLSPFLQTKDGQTLNFAQTYKAVAGLGQMLHAQGFHENDLVLLRAGRRHEGILALLGAMYAGLDVCIVPEGFSARQATEGAVAFAPKLALDAGDLSNAQAETPRIMNIAANLFTVRLVGCFGQAPDGLVAMEDLMPQPDQTGLDELEGDGEAATGDAPSKRDPLSVHTLKIGQDGRVHSVSRTQSHLLSQALLCALVGRLKTSTNVGTAYDPLSNGGLLATVLPALLVGCSVQLFDALDPGLDETMTQWMQKGRHHRAVAPLGFAGSVDDSADLNTMTWITNGSIHQEHLQRAMQGHLLVDCGGVALLPAEVGDGHSIVLPNGAIKVPSAPSPSAKTEPTDPPAAMQFGHLRLAGRAQSNTSAASLVSGDVCVDGVLAGQLDLLDASPVPTGQLGQLADGQDGTMVCQLAAPSDGQLQVGQTPLLLDAINRTLGLSGRWQDAGAFCRADPVLGNRIEVAVQPRLGSENDPPLPTLEQVRELLSESGMGDAALPVRLHLVKQVPWQTRGIVDAEGITDLAWSTVPTAENAEDAPNQVTPELEVA